MKIISQEENWNFDNKTKTITDVIMADSIYKEIPFNLENVTHQEIKYCDDCLILPYNDKALSDAVCGLVYDTSNNNDWVYPDYDKVKLSIMLPMGSNKLYAYLCIDVQPPMYSENSKAEILATASTDITYNECSEYTFWQKVFESAENFHNGSFKKTGENIGIYPIQFTPEEQNNLLWVLLNCKSMVANGGKVC